MRVLGLGLHQVEMTVTLGWHLTLETPWYVRYIVRSIKE